MKNVIAEMKISLGILKDKETLKKKKKNREIRGPTKVSIRIISEIF